MARYKTPDIPLDVTPLLTVNDVCAKWRCSRATLYRAVNSGKLKAVTPGGLMRFRLEDVLTAENMR